LELSAPNWVRTTCRQPNGFSHPSKNIVEYAFPSTKYTTQQLLWKWYDGQYAPQDLPGVTLPEGRKLPEQGALVIGENGSLLVEHKSGPQTLPPELIRSVPRPKIKPYDHHEEWVKACLGQGQTGSPFSYGGPICEALQLGVVANRFPGKKLRWNPEKMQITNLKKANQYLSRHYRNF
ncbi:MAG: gfo/Idh/MocA family oxidoreductase, partial [Verrucomicrobiota bacterium]